MVATLSGSGSWCNEHIRSGKMGTSDTVRGIYLVSVYCTYNLKWKPLFDGRVFGVLNIYGQKKIHNRHS